jgi:hypothetical protein
MDRVSLFYYKIAVLSVLLYSVNTMIGFVYIQLFMKTFHLQILKGTVDFVTNLFQCLG